jgi:RNA polymerase sigma-70 factor (ECF subfamily)
MELQQPATSQRNFLPPLSGADHAHFMRVPESYRDLPDLGQMSVDESAGRPATNATNVEMPSISYEDSGTLLSGNDYALALDDQLLAAARSLDGRAFTELSGRYLRSIRNKVYRIVGNSEDMEDVVQESLLSAYLHLNQFRGSCSFSQWITRIAINTALMFLRRRKVRPEVSFDQNGESDQAFSTWEFPDPSPSAEQTCVRQEALASVSRALNQLPLLYRNVFEQYHVQEHSLREIANELGITVASVKSRLFRARRILRTLLESRRPSLLDPAY